MRRAVAFVAVGAVATRAGAQGVRRTTAETDLTRDPSGVALVHVAKGTALAVGTTKSGWTQATIDGWIVSSALHDDKRDGYDVSVSVTAGTAIREKPGVGATLAVARQGALFDRVETRNGWAHVKRSGWVPVSAFAVPRTVAVAPPPPPLPAAAKNPAPTSPVKSASTPATSVPPPSAATSSRATVTAGSSLALEAGGAPFAATESPVSGPIVEHKNGWTHLRLDVWVRDGELGNGSASDGITAADLRADPDKYTGQPVEWTVEYLGVETADELRPEIPLGDPYVLARGPLPESGFVYIVIPKDSADAFRRLEPLAKLRIRGTIRAGKSRFLPTPVLDFVRRLN